MAAKATKAGAELRKKMKRYQAMRFRGAQEIAAHSRARAAGFADPSGSLSTMPPKSAVAPAKAAIAFFKQAVLHHGKFVKGFNAAKQAALLAGVWLTKAKGLCQHGEWSVLLHSRESLLHERTASRYMDFAAEVLAWAAQSNPGLSGEPLVKAALGMVLESPKGLVALCRDLKLLKQFGEYDPANYEANKLKRVASAEFELTGSLTRSALRWLTPLAGTECSLGDDVRAEDLDTLEGALDGALTRVRALKSTITVESVTRSIDATEKKGKASRAKQPEGKGDGKASRKVRKVRKGEPEPKMKSYFGYQLRGSDHVRVLPMGDQRVGIAMSNPDLVWYLRDIGAYHEGDAVDLARQQRDLGLGQAVESAPEHEPTAASLRTASEDPAQAPPV